MPTLLITGANRGLGLNLLKLYNDDSWTIHACCRNPDLAAELKTIVNASSGRIMIHKLDVEDPATIDKLKVSLGDTPIDMLINMAGYLGEKSLIEPNGLQPFGMTDYDIMEKAYRINCVGPLRLCEAIIKNVEVSDKKTIINVSSIVGSIGEDSFGNFYMYRPSKAALNAISHAMSINLRDRGITVIPLHPGFTKTDMGGPTADINIEESVSGIKAVLDKVTIADSGNYLTWEGHVLPW
ncbi:MAG: SDR family oxidoreductase [Rhodospirillaceae bacterium]